MCWIVLKIIKDEFTLHIISWTFFQQRNIRYTMQQPCMLPILCCRYHSCWCPGDFSRQGISRHGIDPQSWNILSPASDELKPLLIDTKVVKCFSTWQKHLKVIIYSAACKVYTTACCVNMNYSVTIDPPYSQGVICHGCYINSMWPNDAMLHHGP